MSIAHLRSFEIKTIPLFINEFLGKKGIISFLFSFLCFHNILWIKKEKEL